MSERRSGDLALVLRVAREARPYWSHLGLTLVVSLAAAPLALLAPLPLKIAVDSALGDAPVPGVLAPLVPGWLDEPRHAALVLAVALVVVVAVSIRLQAFAAGLLQTWTGERLAMDFRARLFQQAQRLSLSYHDTHGTPQSLYRIQYDAYEIQNVATGLQPFITAGVTLAAMLLVTARLDGALALVALGVCPVLFVLTRASRNRLRHRWREFKEVESRALAIVHETLGSLRVVKAFGQEDHEQRRFLDGARRMLRSQVALANVTGGFNVLVGLTIAVGTAAVLFIGVRHVEAGRLSLGDLLLVMGYLTQVYAPLETISNKIADLQASLVSVGRAFALLDEPRDVPEARHARPLPRAAGHIEFDDVTFTYAGGRRALERVYFAVPPGARVGVVGTSGAGKSTLMSLLMRFYDPTDGRIRLDGVDLRDWRLRDLRDQFAIVLQEPVLFSASVAENVAYGRPQAGHDAIVAAARAANAHEFIVRLPDGYATPVGERGMRLSGGERQRIALARAFLKDAPLLILDEPTSSVDTATESLVIEALERLMVGRTTFIVAHRLSTVGRCDLLLRVEDGRIADLTRLDGRSAVPVAAG